MPTSLLEDARPSAPADPPAPPSIPRPRPATRDVETVAAGIARKEKGARPSRRTVVRSAAWSVPAVAAAMAAPAYAVSLPVCGNCFTAAQQCLLSIGGATGTCTCGPNLVCVGTGPLGLANVCVGTSVLLQTCGGGQCFGVCLSPGGTLVTAINTFTSSITTIANGLPSVCGRTVTATPVPTNVCVSPISNTFGSLCLITGGSGVLGGTVSTTLNTLTATLSSLSIAVSNPCPTGTSCQSITTYNLGGASPACGGTATGTLGYCAC